MQIDSLVKSEVGHGAEGIRTPDLRLAKAAFSQLNYGPSTLDDAV
jgi:hypothetical protein